MKSRTIIISALLGLACFGFAGCSAPTIEASTDEEFELSIEEVRASLPIERRKEFDQALQTIALEELGVEDVFTSVLAGVEPPDPKVRAERLRKTLAGKTAAEILAMGAVIEERRKEREREAALAKIAELEERKSEAQQAARELGAFEVVRARFWSERDRLGMSDPRIRLTVRNGTRHAVSHAFFRGVLRSPGRSVPWLEEDFNYKISGGLEPGEEATWTLALNSFSAWGTVKAPADAALFVEVRRVDGADGEELFSSFGFGPEDETALQALREEHGLAR